MASSKSYDLYLGLGLFVILFSQVSAHVPPEAEAGATNPGREVLDGPISLEEFLRAVHFLESRMKGNMMIPPRLTAEMASDKLMLSGLLFFGFHGALAEERKQGQKFLVDIEAWIDLKPPGKSDNMSDSVNDAKIYGVAKEVLEGPPHYLVESVAQKIAITVLTNHPQISAIRVKVAKPHVAVHGQLDYLGVEIIRHRSDLPV